MPFVLGNPKTPFSADKDKKLRDEIMGRWAAFARTGSPNLPSDEEGEESNEWLPVSVSDTSGMVAADPQYMRFTGDGGAMVESNQEKAEQCAAIFLLNPTFNHSSSNNNNNVIVGSSNEPVSGGVSISIAFVASAASLLAPLAFAVVAVLVMY